MFPLYRIVVLTVKAAGASERAVGSANLSKTKYTALYSRRS
jgi:hypothetical protein